MFFVVIERISSELNQNRQKSNKVYKIILQLNDYVLRSLYVLLRCFSGRCVGQAVKCLSLEKEV